ncbi:MAG: ribonuclease R [Acidobacteria bacterium]|nr:ribonuclease R [Acidobacteriota bacterium]
MKEKLLEHLQGSAHEAFTVRDLLRELGLSGDQRREVVGRLAEREADGLVARLARNKYALVRQQAWVRGKLIAHRQGYGFVAPDPGQGLERDIFVPRGQMGGASHGDLVLVEVRGARRRKKELSRAEGKIVRVIRRGTEALAGKFCQGRRWNYVTPLDPRYLYDIVIPPGQERQARQGMVVHVEILTHPSRGIPATGRVLQVLGLPGDPEIEYRIAMVKHDIPHEFPPQVQAEVSHVPVRVRQADRKGRLDLRKELTVTIDGETAQDFDDAVTLRRLSSGSFRLGVHIADVSHYVPEGSALDQEAFRRGTSVYFPDRAVPMLPPELSSGICSLNPGVDRLSFSVMMEVDPKGRVIRHRFRDSVIRSNERMTYTAVNRILQGDDPSALDRYGYLVEDFRAMEELCGILNRRRRARGAIDFDLPEEEVVYGEEGKVENIVRAERNIAHRIIEEFMLLANETVAQELAGAEVPALYRVHEAPDPAKVELFAELARQFGYRLDCEDGRCLPRDFQRLCDQFVGRPEERFLAYLMLRSFKQAIYSHQNVGHFGLAARYYTHFTSPIRRYPDLLVHRILRDHLRKKMDAQRKEWLEKRLPEYASQSSRREREADEAEREILNWKKALFMKDRVGDVFDGFVSGVSPQGFWVELVDHFVEGLVHASKLEGDAYVFREDAHALVGRRFGRRFRLGDRVSVQVDRVDVERRHIDFSVV